MINPYATLALRALATLALAWLAMGGTVAAQGVTPARISEVQQQIRAGCQGPVTFGRGFHRTANFNGGARPDHIIDYRAAECSGRINSYCGPGGCVLEILISTGTGYTEGFSDNVRTWSVQRRGNRDVLILDLQGSACGRAGNASCPRSLAWNGGRFAPVPGNR